MGGKSWIESERKKQRKKNAKEKNKTNQTGNTCLLKRETCAHEGLNGRRRQLTGLKTSRLLGIDQFLLQ